MSLAITEQHKPKTQQVTPIFPIPTPNGTFTIQQPKQTPKELIQAQQITTKTTIRDKGNCSKQTRKEKKKKNEKNEKNEKKNMTIKKNFFCALGSQGEPIRSRKRYST